MWLPRTDQSTAIFIHPHTVSPPTISNNSRASSQFDLTAPLLTLPALPHLTTLHLGDLPSDEDNPGEITDLQRRTLNPLLLTRRHASHRRWTASVGATQGLRQMLSRLLTARMRQNKSSASRPVRSHHPSILLETSAHALTHASLRHEPTHALVSVALERQRDTLNHVVVSHAYIACIHLSLVRCARSLAATAQQQRKIAIEENKSNV